MYDVYCDRPSKSARLLARALGGSRIRNPDGMGRGHRVINWGTTSAWPDLLQPPINNPRRVRFASNKLSFFDLINRTPYCPSYTTDREQAIRYIRAGNKVVCRQLLNASGGRGIVIARDTEELVDCPLYVRYIKKAEEFRVHIFDGQVIDVQRKARLHSVENPNWQVRNLAGGFIYAREGVLDYPNLPAVTNAAFTAYELTGLDFGAFDVVMSSRDHVSHPYHPYVLEVNTAPGLMGTTLERYVSHLQNRNQ